MGYSNRGNDDLLGIYVRKSLEALELEQEEKHKISELFSVPFYHGSAKNNKG